MGKKIRKTKIWEQKSSQWRPDRASPFYFMTQLGFSRSPTSFMRSLKGIQVITRDSFLSDILAARQNLSDLRQRKMRESPIGTEEDYDNLLKSTLEDDTASRAR